MNRHIFLENVTVGSTFVIGLPLADCIGLGTSGADPETVDGTPVELTDGNRFESDTVRVRAGESVVWRNVGYVPHTVTASEDEIPPDASSFSNGNFTSGSSVLNGASGDEVPNRDDEYEYTFGLPGTCACYYSPYDQTGMTGGVTVEATTASEQRGASVR